VGDAYTYTVNMPVGGTNSTWVIRDMNGNILTTLDDGGYFAGPPPYTQTRVPVVWNTVGTYQLCVDVYNACVPVGNAPTELCKTIRVLDAEAGTITAVDPTGCPGRIVNLSVTGNNTSSGISQYILVVNNSTGNIVQVTQGTNGTFTYNGCGNFTAYSYNYITSLFPVPTVGQPIAGINTACSAGFCCDLDSAPFSFSDNSPPVFTSPPANITVSCIDNVPPMTSLDYTDNCLPPGSVNGVQTGTANTCGGSLTRTWTITDGCNNTATHTQTITITPNPAATFTPFNDITVSCTNFPATNFLPPLNYTNNQTGACLISGSIIPTRVVDTTNCMGTVTYNWQATDMCGRTISDQQVYTIQPPPVATFTPFDDITVACIDAPPVSYAPQLTYSNGLTGQCGVSGTITPVRTQNITNCAGTITYTWSGNDRCGRPIFDQQIFTVLPPPVIAFINPPPATGTIQCGQLPAPGVLPPLAYDNGSTGNCRIYGTVIPTRTDSYTKCGGTLTYNWAKTDSCGRSISHTQVLTVLPAPPPVFISPPSHVTYPCGQLVPDDYYPPLYYSNGLTGFCEISGSVIPTRVNNVMGCTGTVTLNWNYTDPCGRSISHQQIITLSPPDLPAFINPPANITVSCPNAPDPNNLPTLDFSNGSSGACLLAGTVTSTRTGNLVNCQGVYTYTWQYTDYCGRTITHIQNVTIQQPTPAAFINPPANITVDCPNAPDPNVLPTLDYANGMTGSCGINGSVQATRTGNLVNCAGVYTYTWQITDQCNRVLTHTQTVTILAPPQAAFINPPANITVDCPNAPDPNVLPTLDYANGMTGSCGINGSIQATRTGSLVNCAGVYTYTWQITDQCNRVLTHTQTITIQAPPPAAFINPPANITVDCPNAPDPNVLPTLDYANGMTGSCGINGSIQATRTGSLVNCAGVYTYTWQITDQCNRVLTHTQTVTIQAPPPAAFINPPANITVDCPNAPDPNVLPTLNYANGMTGSCGINGSVQATFSGNLVNCAGVYTYTWQITDQCNRVLTHTQTVTIQAPPPAAFINPPVNITVDCPNAPDPNVLPILEYANGMTGSCGINGQVEATRAGSLVNCAGVYTYTWQITDQCNRVLTHTQTVTIQAPPPAAFINPPANITVDCPNAPDPNVLPTLNYANGMTGSCGINGSVQATFSGNLVNCAGVYTYTWQITDQCNRILTHTQTVTIQAPPPAAFINPPANITVDCPNAPDPNVLPILDYTNGMTGSCGINGQVEATRTGSLINCAGAYTYTWQITDQCNRVLTHTQTVTILAPPPASFINPPANITVDCPNAPDPNVLPALEYSNGLTGTCGINGQVQATVTTNGQNCNQTFNYTWNYTDQCGRTLQWTQTITVLPPTEASFINPPDPLLTLTCDQEPDPSLLPPLSYTNGETGACAITGSVIPVRTVVTNNCSKTITYNWLFTDICGRVLTHSQVLNILPPPEAVLVNPPVYNTSLTCDEAEVIVFPGIDYSNNTTGCLISGTLNPTVSKNFNACGGNIQVSWSGTDICGRPLSYNQIILVNPAPVPTITTALPVDVTIDCQDISAFTIPLLYSNGSLANCARQGVLNPSVSGNFNICGGTAILNWSGQDICGHQFNVTQSITIEPAPVAQFINVPPSSQTSACNVTLSNPPPLFYSNGEVGLCNISGSVTPIQTGGYNTCGGTIQYTWQYTDVCGRPIIYNQDIVVSPASDPVFINVPPDVLLPCGQSFGNPPILSYNNGLTGLCGISGSVNATTTDLGDSRIYTWTYTNPCNGNQITADQEVTLRPVPDIVVDPNELEICFGQTFDLSTLNVTDLNGSSPTLTYHNNIPPNAFNQVPGPVISTDIYTTYYIKGTNSFGCSDYAEVNFTNIYPPNAGIGQSQTICNDGNPVNFWNYLTPPYDNNGYWNDTNNSGVNIGDPANVSFAGKPPGNYQFDYIVPSGTICPDAVATIQIVLVNPGTYQLQEVQCAPDFQTYTVKITVQGYNLTTSAGTITSAGNLRTVSGIPIGQPVTLTLNAIAGNCAQIVLTINPPQCNCPVIGLPVSGGNKTACEGQSGVSLTVTVPTGLSAAWFDAPSGGNLLQNNSLSYQPPTVMPGTYTYHVQAIDPLNGCFGQRIPIIFEVYSNPNPKNATLNACDDNNDGITVFDLNDSKPLIITGSSYTFDFYLNQTDAQNEVNKITNLNYTNLANDQVLYVSVKNTNGCRDIVQLTLHVLPNPMVSYSVLDESCEDENDGSITINPPFANLEFKLSIFPWTSSNVFSDLPPNDYVLSVRDTNLCLSQYNVTIDPGQELSFGSFDISCNNNGSGSNGNDDYYTIRVVINSINSNSTTYSLIYQGVDLGDFIYGTVATVNLPADGNTGILTIKDNATNCQITKEIGPLTPCSTNCEITINNLSVTCNDNGTTSDPADDIYTISFLANVVNGGSSTSFVVLINGVISGTYSYNTPVSFQIPATNNPPIVTVRDFLNIQCSTVLPVGNLSGCSGACDISYVVSNIQCLDQGTINDPADDTYTFTIRVTGSNTSAAWLINGSNTSYPYNTNVQLGPYLISQGVLSLVIHDQADANCSENVAVTPPPACSEPCVLTVSELTIGACDNNNTNNTAVDDKFSVTFKVNVVSGFTNFYNVKFGTQTFGPFVYGNVITISGLPASGQNLTLSIMDAINSGCNTQVVVKQNPCSQCTQTVNAGPDIQLTCSQNTASLSGTASATGGVFVWTGPNGFNKTGQTVTTSAEGTYIMTVTFPDQCVVKDSMVVTKDANLPVANAGPDAEFTCIKLDAVLTGSSNLASNVAYTWTNAAGQIISTQQSVTVNALGFYYLEVTNTLNNCKSGKDEVEVFNRNQQLSFNTRNWICSNNGTPSTGNDDTYTVTFNVSNSTGAVNKFSVLENGVLKGSFNYGQDIMFIVPADGNEWQYEFVDEVTGCKTTTKVGPMNSCSTNCLISYDNLDIQCNDNGTESVDTDDYYTISFTVSALNSGVSNTFRVLLDGIEKSTHIYGTTVTLTLPADGNKPFLVLEDLNISACQAVIPMNDLNPCSSTCTVSGTVSNILCNDNGTINDPTDDYFTFDVIMGGLNTSVTWSVEGKQGDYNYNERINFGPYPISGGQATLIARDNLQQDCKFEITVQAPPVCSEPCVIQMSNLTLLACNDNNTGNNTSDDYFGITFRVNRVSGSVNNYLVTLGTKTYGPYIYGETVTITDLPANGTSLTLTVSDPSNSGCTTTFQVQMMPCSSCDQKVDAGADQIITCQQNVITLSGTSAEPGMYTWTGPGGFQKSGLQAQTSQPGTYIFTAIYPNQCEARDTIEVTKDSSVPEAFAGLDTTLNCKTTTITLNGLTNLLQNAVTTWTDISGNIIGTGSTITVNTPGSYFFEVTNITNNCKSGKDEVIIDEDKEKPDATIIADPGNLLDCIVGTILLSGKPVANVVFNWQTGETTIYNQNSITVNSEGLVTMIAQDTLNGCENSSSIEIIDLQDYPILVVDPVEPITCQNNGVVISAENSPEGPNLSFSWYDSANNLIPGETADTLFVTEPGLYYVILTDTFNNCFNKDTILVDRIGDFPVVNVPPDITLYCGETKTSLQLVVQNPTSPYTILWQSNTGTILSNAGNANVSISGEGIYTASVTYNSSGCKSTDKVNVTVNSDFPVGFDVSLTDESCKNEKDGSISVNSIAGGVPPITYRLNGAATDNSGLFSPLAPGLYTILVRDANGCEHDTTIVVKNGNTINLTTLSPIEIIYNQTQILQVLTNLNPDDIASVVWTPSENLSCDTCLTTEFKALKDEQYVVTITDKNGCAESITIIIRVRENIIITTPNIIDPNSPVNNYFTIYGNDNVISIEKLRIYDRWGNLVFEKSGFKPNIPELGWDGKYKGKDVVPGVYVFSVDYLAPSGLKNYSGDITVLR